MVMMEIPPTLPAWFGRFFSVSLGASPGYVWLSQLPMLCFFFSADGRQSTLSSCNVKNDNINSFEKLRQLLSLYLYYFHLRITSPHGFTPNRYAPPQY
jgi:hypothetical protein